MAEGGIWIFSENKQIARELLAGGRSLAKSGDSVSALAIGDQTLAQEYLAHGADWVFLFPPIKSLPLEAYASAMADLIKIHSPGIMLIGATSQGKALSALLAGALSTGCSTECRNIRMDEGGNLLADRLVYGGVAVTTETCPVSPYILTVPIRSFTPLEKNEVHQGEIIEVPFSGDLYPARVIERQPMPKDAVDVSEANIVVSFGRGLSRQEDISIIEALAEELDAAVGCTRPIVEDFHWLPKDRHIGISGKTVRGKLYVLVGSSGQIQHTAGVTAKVVLAVNKDENAPIFEAADYGIVADLYEVVPALTAAVKKLKG